MLPDVPLKWSKDPEKWDPAVLLYTTQPGRGESEKHGKKNHDRKRIMTTGMTRPTHVAPFFLRLIVVGRIGFVGDAVELIVR